MMRLPFSPTRSLLAVTAVVGIMTAGTAPISPFWKTELSISVVKMYFHFGVRGVGRRIAVDRESERRHRHFGESARQPSERR